jgi:hydrogenase maturation factor
MERVVYRSLGSASARVVTGPGIGLDNAVLAIDHDTRMLITADPVSIIPQVGVRESAWLSVHLIASDYATSGHSPEFATFTYNMPQEMRTEEVEAYLRAIGNECNKLGVSVVAGHTGSYPGGGYTVVGGGTMFGFCRVGEFIDPTMARPGDAVLMTKGAAIEATALLAHSFPKHVEHLTGRTLARRARDLLHSCSTVKDALKASSLGLGREGVTSMHDATEGGILGGLEEMARTSRKAFHVEIERVHVPAECIAVCGAFGIDPLSTVSEGSLLLTCNPSKTEELRRRLRRNAVPVFEIGTVKGGRGLWVSRGGRRPRRGRPSLDRYWSAYDAGLRRGLR